MFSWEPTENAFGGLYFIEELDIVFEMSMSVQEYLGERGDGNGDWVEGVFALHDGSGVVARECDEILVLGFDLCE